VIMSSCLPPFAKHFQRSSVEADLVCLSASKKLSDWICADLAQTDLSAIRRCLPLLPELLKLWTRVSSEPWNPAWPAANHLADLAMPPLGSRWD
jgi:hypothetical protein